MSIIISNANIITGDGKTVLENSSIFINGEIIETISHLSAPFYNFASQIIDAAGDFIIPGLINHHAHGNVSCPQPCWIAQPALDKSRIMQNQSLHMVQGETTVLNLDGFATMDEVEVARALTPMSIQTSTLHLPLHFKDAQLVNFGGLKEKHLHVTAEEMIKQGAIVVGEVGAAGIGHAGDTPDITYYDAYYIPFAVMQATGVMITSAESALLKRAIFAKPPDEKAAKYLLAKIGIPPASISPAMERLRELVNHNKEHAELAIALIYEAAKVAGKLGVPMDMHTAPHTKSQVRDVAKELKGLLIAAHSNFLFKPCDAIDTARTVKKEGSWVGILTGDFYRARRLLQNHATTLALLEEGLVDIIATDYVGGYWDSILRVMEYAVNQNVLSLPQAIAMATGNVVKAIPNIAPNRGEIAAGKIADLVIVSKNSISDVRTVIIGGKVVVDEGRIVPSPKY